MTKNIEIPSEINTGFEGSTFFINDNGKYYPTLRVEVSTSNRFNLEEASRCNKLGTPYIPNHRKNLYIKPPYMYGSFYETNSVIKRFSPTSNINVLGPHSFDNTLFNPYISWHGGYEEPYPFGKLAIRGYKNGSNKKHFAINEAEAIAKDDFEGNYFAIAEVLIPPIITTLPDPVCINDLVNPYHINKFDFNKFSYSQMFDEKIDFIIDRQHVIGGGLSTTFFIHNPSPVHKSRFHINEIRSWALEPISLTPCHDVALACSVVFKQPRQELVLDDAPFFFMAYPNNGKDNENFIFSVHKTILKI